MAQTFFPKKYIMVPASAPHPENTEYKVSIGYEKWDDTMHKVIKVQMVYDGVIAGRRSPSYPLDKDDYYRVNDAIQRLHAEDTNALINVW
ncbi:hypothetical protein ABFY60_15510 [Lysinibacillus pakistanensis]|uniref:hypothetical protein n=1 Tax=Lysinibacillus pakistanensis TaxID=759811 RepID=UPI003D281898